MLETKVSPAGYSTVQHTTLPQKRTTVLMLNYCYITITITVTIYTTVTITIRYSTLYSY